MQSFHDNLMIIEKMALNDKYFSDEYFMIIRFVSSPQIRYRKYNPNVPSEFIIIPYKFK